MSRWFCLTVEPQKEFAAELILKRLNVAAFVPVELKTPRASRKRSRRNLDVPPRKYPMFGSRYCFAFLAGQAQMFDLTMRIHIIKGVVGIRGKPFEFPLEAIDYLMRKSGQNIPHVAAPNPHASFAKGEIVEITEGPFEGHVVPIEEIKGELAQFVIKILGKEQRLQLPLEILRAA